MIVIRNTSAHYLHQMAERMGPETLKSEAEAMVEILIERGYQFADTSDIPGDVWFDCLQKATQ